MHKHLTHNELYYIWQHRINKFGDNLLSCDSINTIANRFNKHISTIYRAIAYLKKTNWRPEKNTHRTRKKHSFKIFNDKTQAIIKDRLKLGWSPEVICGRVNKESNKKLSFKTIYRYIWNDKVRGGSLYKLLPHKGKRYKYGDSKRCKIPNRVDISQRPAIVNEKTRIGDLEGDTIIGVRGTFKECLLTLVDRSSKFTMVRKIPNKTAYSVEKAMDKCYEESTIPFLTVTYDNGTEFTNHQKITESIGCDVYFARPYRSCDRGLNEHTNGLIRRYFPKKTDFSKITDEKIQQVQDLLNNRPRKSLNYLTPNEVVNAYITKAYKNFSHLT